VKHLQPPIRKLRIDSIFPGESRPAPIGAALEQIAARSRVAVRIDVDASRLRAQDTHAVVGATSRIQQETSWRPQIPFERLLDDLLADARASLRSV